MNKRVSRIGLMISLSLGLSVASGCGNRMDPESALGKKALIEQVNLYLTDQKCSEAIALIQPVYESENTDNQVRMAMAQSYACQAGVNLFGFIAAFLENSSSLLGSGFWDFLTLRYPSNSSDRIVEAAQLSQDALHSVLRSGVAILPSSLYNSSGFNPSSLKLNDRETDANAFLYFVSVAAIGGIQSRYGSPNASGKRTVALPWTAPTDFVSTGSTTQADGCAYASAIVNYVDSLAGLATATTGNVSTTFQGLQTTFEAAIYTACNFGCVTTCGLSACATCPDELRNRSSCAGTVTDRASCAASGILNFIQNTPGIGWDLAT